MSEICTATLPSRGTGTHQCVLILLIEDILWVTHVIDPTRVLNPATEHRASKGWAVLFFIDIPRHNAPTPVS